MEISDLMPHLAGCADDIALIRSMYGEHANHEPALFLMHTGRTVSSRPSMGAWVAYGLGSVNQNLPAYVVMSDGAMNNASHHHQGRKHRACESDCRGMVPLPQAQAARR